MNTTATGTVSILEKVKRTPLGQISLEEAEEVANSIRPDNSQSVEVARFGSSV